MSDYRTDETCPCGATYSLNVIDDNDQRIASWRHEHRKCRQAALDADHAVANEREKIAAMIERLGAGFLLVDVPAAVRAGQHWKDGN